MFTQPKFGWFQCNIDDNFDKSFRNSGGYIEGGDTNYDLINENISKDATTKFSFFGRMYDESVWLSDIDILILLARKGIMLLEQADTSYKTTDYSEIRKNICELFLATRTLFTGPKVNYDILNNIIIPQIKIVLSNHITRLKYMPDYIIFNSIEPEDVNHHAAYNYLHLTLDMYWLLNISVDHLLEEEQTVQLEVFETNLQNLLIDLIYVADEIFNRSNNYTDLSKLSPYICSCFKELWFLIQIHVEKLHNQHFCKDFWCYYNQAINKELFENCDDGKQAIKNIWLLYHVSRLQGYDKNGDFIGPDHSRVFSNFTLIEQSLRIITNIYKYNIDEQLICSSIHLIGSLQTNWWKKDASFDLLQILWDYFYKRLNTSFSITNENINLANNTNKSIDYSILTDNILKHDLNSTSSSLTSYEIFLSILGKYLTINPLHWPKLKGRIYSKLPVQKLAIFTENGLHNFVQLFFVLAYSVNFAELTDKLQFLLNQLPEKNLVNSSVAWNSQVSILFMRAQRRIPVSDSEICTPSILFTVQSASSDRSKSHLMRIFIDGIKKLIDCDSGLHCQEYVLLDDWINRYLRWCSHTDACNLLNIFIQIVKKVSYLGENRDWWRVMEMHVVPSIKELSLVSDSPLQVAELAATLITADMQKFTELLEHMLSDSINTLQVIKFITILLEKHSSSVNSKNNLDVHQPILIQTWIRIALLNTDKTELTELTKLMTHLPNWPEIIGSFDIHNEDPLFAVIRLAGFRIRDAVTFFDTFAVKKWFETYFGRMDQWVTPILNTAERGDNIQLVLRIYTCASLLFYHCSTALYVKNKSTCILYRLISILLLPSAVLLNKKPSNIILTSLRRTWHLFVRGIGRLDFKSDNYIERTMKDMVVRYVPHMYDSSSPILRCIGKEFENPACAFILEKIAVTFLPCKSKNTHEFSNQALKLILEMIKVCTDNNKTKIFVEIFVPHLFELLIFVEDLSIKNIVYNIIQCLKLNTHYPQFGDIMDTSFINVINKHLSFYSTNVFKFLESLIPITPTEIEHILPNIKEAILKVEGMRGVGIDNTLRKGLNRIQELLNQQSSKC